MIVSCPNISWYTRAPAQTTAVTEMRYLMIGNGRVATHMSQYLQMLGLDFLSWHRGKDEALLRDYIEQATHVLLLISDDAIKPFVRDHAFKPNQCLIHFSGALVSDLAYGVHPLNTFAAELYDLATYQSMPFIIDDDAPAFADLLPGIPNAHFRLAKSQRPLYHALCVMSGNFTVLLWQKAFADFENKLGIPKECLHLYLQTVTQNLLSDPASALTGPLARGDQAVIEKNLQSLSGDAYQQIYQAFVDVVKGD